jgi:glycosyltransferase involved in cell wall biosynthesis
LADEFDVAVICGQPRAIADEVPADASELAVHNRVKIRRVAHTQFDKASFFGRLANMISFQLGATWAAMVGPRADIVDVETDPPFLCLLGGALQLLRGSRLVCYLQDIYPDVAVALGKLRPGFFASTLRRLFFRVYCRSDAVIVLSRDMRELLIDGGVSSERVQVVPNWADTSAVVPRKENNRFRCRHGLEDKFVVMYSGNMGLSQRLEQILEAAEVIRDRRDIVFAMVGNGADRRNLERQATARQLCNVKFFDYQAKAELADSLSAADVHVVILRPEVQRLLMPSKLYGVLSSGTPALVLADADCELAGLVAENDLGTVVSGDETTKMVEVILRYAEAADLVARQGSAARVFAVSHCGRNSSVSQIRRLLRELMPAGSMCTATKTAASRA